MATLFSGFLIARERNLALNMTQWCLLEMERMICVHPSEHWRRMEKFLPEEILNWLKPSKMLAMTFTNGVMDMKYLSICTSNMENSENCKKATMHCIQFYRPINVLKTNYQFKSIINTNCLIWTCFKLFWHLSKCDIY